MRILDQPSKRQRNGCPEICVTDRMLGGSDTQDVLVGVGVRVNVGVGVPGWNDGVGVGVGVHEALGVGTGDGVKVIVCVGVRVAGQPAMALCTPRMSVAMSSTG